MTATLPEQQQEAEERTVIRRPGLYDLPEEVYHADPVPGGSLSSTGARRLLECPARFRYEQAHPPAPKPHFDFGTAAHKLVLGVGPELAVIDAPDWRTKAARDAAREARERGAVPLKRNEYEQIQAMAAALRAHPVAGPIFTESAGRAEQSLFWQDPETRVVCRARVDHLPHPTQQGRLILADYKTCVTADPRKLPRVIAEHGYHLQAAWYMDGVRALGAGEDVAFLFVFQEKTAPHLVTVVELDHEALQVGAYLAREARQLYAACRRTGRWPGYSDDSPVVVSLPSYYSRQFEEHL
ncbi:MAG UNVERIFIED_CONTAM: PD-(D/E)XK nuclease-like domain-containing protein [Thermobifida fusca]